MSDVMMTLGGFQFGIDSAAYQEFRRTTEYRWPSQERFGQAPVRQYVGPGNDIVTLPGVIYPHWKGGRFQLVQLRSLAAVGIPRFMIDGTGAILGRWVIERIEDGQTIFGPSGVALRQEFSLGLAWFDDPNPGANRNMIPDEIRDAQGPDPAAALQLAAGSAGGLMAGLQSAAANVQSMVGQVQTAVQPAIDAVRTGMTAASNLRNAAIEAQSLVKRVGSINSLSSAEAALGGLMRTSSSMSAMAAGAGATLKKFGVDLAANGEPPAVLAQARAAMTSVNRVATTATTIRGQAESIYRMFK
jgi:phage protein U